MSFFPRVSSLHQSFFGRFSRKSLLLSILPLLVAGNAAATPTPDDFSARRAKLLSYVLREELQTHHYTHKAINDELSRSAYALYLKQLDAQKRFLLQADVDRLQPYATRIDDELNQGVIELPALAGRIMDQRVAQVRDIVRALLKEDIDFRKQDQIETDPEKLAYCQTEAELRERWRKTIKYQALTRYLNMLEEKDKDAVHSKSALDKTLMAEAIAKVGKSTDQFFTRLIEEKAQDQFDSYFGAVTEAFDPHTNYLPPTQKEDFDISMRGSLEGIGATLREEDGYIRVTQVIPGSAAWRQGQLQAEDTILKVAEGKGEPVDITDMRLRDAVSLIRGKKGTEVRLTVKKSDGTQAIIPIVRDVVQIEETFARGTTLKDDASGKNFGYIRIPSFYRDFQGSGRNARNVTDDVSAELSKLKAAKIDGLIIDLRNNGGGALTDAVSIAGLFIEQGPVVQVRSSDGKTQVLDDDDKSIGYGGPLVVLVNEFSASASEILAGALQDYRRAVIVGSAHTHGKGTVQAMFDLDRSMALRNMDQYKPLGALKITIQKFYRISGGSTQYRGIVPDIVLPDRLQYLKSGEQYLDNSLPWDTVAPTSYFPWPQGIPDVAHLRARSEQRIKTDPRWQTVVREAAQARARSEKTLVSLQFDTYRKEWLAERKLLENQQKESGMSHRPDAGKKVRPPLLSEADKLQQMAKDAGEDPVTREAFAVLNDILGNNGAVATTPQGHRKTTNSN